MFRSFLKVVGNVWKSPGLFRKSQSWQRKISCIWLRKSWQVYTVCIPAAAHKSGYPTVSNHWPRCFEYIWTLLKLFWRLPNKRFLVTVDILNNCQRWTLYLPIYKQQNNGIPIIVSINKWPCCFSQVFMNIAFNTKGWWKVSDTSTGEVGY